MRYLIAVLIALTLAGCGESVGEKNAREQTRQDIKDAGRGR